MATEDSIVGSPTGGVNAESGEVGGIELVKTWTGNAVVRSIHDENPQSIGGKAAASDPAKFAPFLPVF